jgi:broad specificity phosphatase PhoE
MPTRLILIRHGSTDWNSEKRYSGFIDIGLNDKGKNEARSLYKRLKQEKIHKVYTSDRKRAIQTAKIIFRKQEIETIPDLREIHFGCFEGLTHKEIIKKHSKIYKKWLNYPFRVAIPGGEDLNDFRKRIINTVKKIISLNPNKTIAAVCHGGPISILITKILKSNNFWRQIPASASLSIIEYENGKAKIRLLNDTAHLGRFSRQSRSIP